MELSENDVVIVSKEKEFWITKKEFEERIIKTLEHDSEEIPRLIEFHKEVLKACEEKINKLE